MEKEKHPLAENDRKGLLADYAVTAVVISYITAAFFSETVLTAAGSGAAAIVTYFIIRFLTPRKHIHEFCAAICFAFISIMSGIISGGAISVYAVAICMTLIVIVFNNPRAIAALAIPTGIHFLFSMLSLSGVYASSTIPQVAAADIAMGTMFFALTGFSAWYSRVQAGKAAALKQCASRARSFEVSRSMHISFAREISRGNLEADITPEAGDELGNALVEMRRNLKESDQRERNEKYIHTGMTEINLIIRQNNTDVEAMCSKLIAFIIRHLNANQGGVFVTELEGEETVLVLKACYAYNRKKFLDKKLLPGDGLVGQCYLEGSRVYLREVPKNYISISSGLGEALPRVVVLTPLKNENSVEGVIEVAAFNELEKHKLDFLDKAAESISSALYSSKISEKTRRLYEESTQRAEQLRAQEEEMRQNLEELTATQEVIRRNSLEMEGRMEGINRSGISFIEFNREGMVTMANDNFLEMMGYRLETLRGKPHNVLLKGSSNREDDRLFWEELKNGRIHAGEYERVDSNGQVKYLRAGYTPIPDVSGRIDTVMMFCIDLTEMRNQNRVLQEQEEEMKQHMEEMKATQDELSRKNEEAYERERQMEELMKEMKANEADLQRIEKKYRDLTREYLLLQKRALLKKTA